MFENKNNKENNMIALGVIGFIVVMAIALALTLNSAALHGWVK